MIKSKIIDFLTSLTNTGRSYGPRDRSPESEIAFAQGRPGSEYVIQDASVEGKEVRYAGSNAAIGLLTAQVDELKEELVRVRDDNATREEKEKIMTSIMDTMAHGSCKGPSNFRLNLYPRCNYIATIEHLSTEKVLNNPIVQVEHFIDKMLTTITLVTLGKTSWIQSSLHPHTPCQQLFAGGEFKKALDEVCKLDKGQACLNTIISGCSLIIGEVLKCAEVCPKIDGVALPVNVIMQIPPPLRVINPSSRCGPLEPRIVSRALVKDTIKQCLTELEEQEEQEEFIVPDIPGAAAAGPSGLDGRPPRVLFPAVTVADTQNIDKKSKKNNK